MSEVRLVVRDAAQDWSGTLHASLAECAIAALSADPSTLVELEAACGRYQKRTSNHPILSNLKSGLRDEPYDAGIVVIDLAARLILVDSTYSSPQLTSEICYHNGDCGTNKWLRYHLANDWVLIHDPLQWAGRAAARRRERTARPPMDARAVLYGRPLLEFVARETFAVAAVDREQINDTLKEIHVTWLLTQREDLRGASPRDVLLERHDQIGWDLQNQADRWAALDEAPPGRDESAFAYRFGGFGTHEFVEYYNLVRELLWCCRDRLLEMGLSQAASNSADALTVGDFLTSEVPRLERIREEWLDSPDPECHGRTPRSIINRERARLPEVISACEAIVDPDCPCCQMLAELPGPVFWHLDGCEMEDDFAFDMHHRTREEWEAEQRSWEMHFESRRGSQETGDSCPPLAES
ncbi:hypothetical protein [Planctomicrobium piriforme]|uniref:Uncharacterized protein n=1 Tax=Planctomicrobium piriforme TaxID=1576369 RepID=A0A1I3L707_9PLAN|nr:hypothetical protein [Planctomicrobium piriforme]SFI80215.1 hypothetical protein SAMN05421753_112152 [Planctomicrobium piriforme]